MTPPRPFPMDAQNRAQDLASTILSAATPPQITAACSAVDSFLHRHASDQCRAFFSVAFPALVSRLFGFLDPPSSSSSTAWIDSPDLSPILSSLLSPDGSLLSSISSVDRHSLVRYIFPQERLPEWMRVALRSDRLVPVPALSDLCPLFKNRIKEDKLHGSYQLQLNVFEYYIFWFAYYPVCKGNSESCESGTIRKSRRFRLENWTLPLPILSATERRPGNKTECALYLRLLYAYLRAFVPSCGLGSHQPYRSSLLHYSPSYDGFAYAQGEFLVYSFVHFWMVDNDFSPLPVGLCRSFGISFPHRVVSGETPPTAGLGDVLKLMVKYLNSMLIAPAEGNEQKVFGGSPAWKVSGLEDAGKSRAMLLSFDNAIGSWNLVMQRPLYRFILRTYLFCPMGASIKNASQVFSLWVTYLEPWKTTPKDFDEFDSLLEQNSDNSRKEKHPSDGKNKGGKEMFQVEPMFSPIWQGYVLSNYLYYSSLVVHFLGFAHKFLHANVEPAIQMVSKLLNILTSSKELIILLKKVDAAYHSKSAGPCSSYQDSVHKYVPSIREQLQDWEDGLSESELDGSFLHENWNCDLKLFSDGEDGAHKLLQLFVLRAEHEVQSSPGDVSQSLQALDSIRSQMNLFFNRPRRDSQSPVSHKEPPVSHHEHGEVFTPKHPGFGKRKWADVRYKGDWMKRPISGTEVEFLAKLFIRISVWLNDVVGLDGIDSCDPSTPTYVQVPCDEAVHVGGCKEFFWMVLALLGSWLGLFRHSLLKFMRRHQVRINLRPLASKKVMMALVLYAVTCLLKRAFAAVCCNL